MMASFLGSPAAGIALMSVNYFRVGRAAAGMGAIVAAIFADGVVGAAIYGLPQGAWLVIWIAAMIPMFYFARMLQGDMVEQHQVDGGDMAAPASSISIGVAGLVFIAVSAFGLWKYSAPVWGTKVTLSHNFLYYSGDVKQDEAQNLGYALFNVRFFVKHGDNRTVLIFRDKHGTVIRYITNIAWKDDPGTLQRYINITTKIAPSVGGLPITLKMVDDDLIPMKSYLVK